MMMMMMMMSIHGFTVSMLSYNNYNYQVSSCLAPKFVLRCNWQVAAAPWWLPVKGAYWRRPEGPDSHIRDRYTNWLQFLRVYITKTVHNCGPVGEGQGGGLYISSVSILAVFILYFTWSSQCCHSLNTILTSMSLFHAVNLMGQFYPNRTIFLRYEPFESSTQTSFLTFGKFRFQENVRRVATIPGIPFSPFLGVVFTWPVMANTSANRLLPFYLTWSSTYS